MKKQIEAKLVSIAHKLLQTQLKSKQDIALLYKDVTDLQKQLAVLEFIEENTPVAVPDTSLEKPKTDTIAQHTTKHTEVEEFVIPKENQQELTIEKEPQKTETPLSQETPKQHILATATKKTSTITTRITKDFSSSLNDRFKADSVIGLNDRYSFITNLFKGDAFTYHSVLSKLETIPTLEQAESYIFKEIKPLYNNWEGQEQTEERFLEIVTNKFL